MSPTLQKILNALEKADSIPAKEKERLRKELEKTEKTLQKKDTQLSAQARELEIETALERIRARSMAMHSSEELNDVLRVMFQQIEVLGIDAKCAHLTLMDLENNTFSFRITGKNGAANMGEQIIDLNAMPIWKETVAKWKKAKAHSHQCLVYAPEILPDLWKLIDTSLKSLPAKERIKISDFPNGLFDCEGHHKFGYIGFNNSRPPTEEEISIAIRFAREFETVYQRFLDIKKAEAQTREAQIQLSLERVRARSMAMHSSEELNDVLSILFQQFDVLGIKPLNVWLSLYNLEENTFTYRATGTGGSRVQGQQVIDLAAMDIWQEQLEQWKSGNAEPVLVTFYPPEVLPQLMEVFKETFDAMPAEERMDPKLFPDGGYNVQGYTKFGYIGYNHLQAPTQEEKDILLKFATEFERVYQRFMEIKKAEGQAREAQIEAALERVRAASMAMHKTGEISEVVTVLFDQLNHLNVPFLQIWITILNLDKDYFDIWFSPLEGVYETTQYFTMPSMYFEDTAIKTWRSKAPFSYRSLKSVAEVDEFINACDAITGSTYFSHGRKIKNYNQLEFIEARHEYGFISKSNTEPPTETEANILQRFAKVFEQAYTRFLDIEKAEAQARESQIEAALEKVRSQSLAMHSTGEMQLVANAVFEQLQALGLEMDVVGMSGVIGHKQDYEVWIGGAPLGSALRIPYNEDTQVQRDYNKMLKDRPELFARTYSGQVKKEYIDHLLTHGDFPKALKKKMETSDAFTTLIAPKKNSGIQVVRYTDQPYTDQDAEILKRFAGVFEQAYIRFIDLEKAEAQAREAQIEASLERIRARAMAMKSSEELHDVLCVLFQQFDVLGIKPISAFLSLFSSEERVLTYRATGTSGARTQGSQTVAIDSLEVWKEIYDKWKTDTSDAVEVIHYPKEILPKLFELFEETFASMPADERMTADHFPEGGYTMHGHTRFGYIGYNHTRLPTEEEKEILTKFATEFERVYRRFLDIEKAEAQARQAQIEAALERVRTRTTAMHNTEDIAATVTTFFNEIMGLGLGNTTRSGIGILSQSEKMELWTASIKDTSDVVLQSGLLDMTIHPLLQGVKKAWQAGDPHFTYELSGEDKLVYFKAINKAPEYPMKIDLKKLPETVYHYSFPFRDGSLFVFSNEHVPDDIRDIFKRFAAVFGQTYTRYLDLHKAEAQAREAKIEAALEKVRSASLAMHQSKDLHNVLVMLYNQLDALGLKMHSAQISESIEDPKAIHSWIVTSGAVYPEQVHAPFSKNIYFKRFREAVTNGESFYTLKLSKQQKDKHFHHIFDNSSLKNVPQARKDLIFSSPGLGTSNAIGKYTSLSIMRYDGILYSDEENEIIKRFLKVFEQSYTRFLDLQKAESQAREAHIEAAIEKVRSQSLAMHTTSEMQQVANAVYAQLKELGLEMDAVGMSGAIEAKEDYDVWIGGSTFDKPLRIPFNDATQVQRDYNQAIESRSELFVRTYSGEIKKEYTNHLLSHGLFPKDLKKLMLKSDAFSTSISFAKNSSIQIARYTAEPYSEKENDILIRFGKVFEQAYIRFMDLQKAEAQARESQIQLSLERVRARAMAMQSSDELHEVLGILFQQFDKLGIQPINVFLSLFDQEARTLTYRASGKSGTRIPGKQVVEVDSMEPLKALYDKWIHDNSDTVEVVYYPKEILPQLFGIFADTFGAMPEEDRMGPDDFPDGGFSMAGYTPFGYLGYDHQRKATEEEKNILSRFCTEFTRVYQRFLDLQRSEAQAREAQIEAALEKVRSRSLAMQKPEELQEVVAVVGEKLQELGVILDSGGVVICTYFPDSKDVMHWTATFDPAHPSVPYYLPYFDTPIWKETWASKWESDDDFFEKIFSFKDKNHFFHKAFEISDYKNLPEEHKKELLAVENHALSFAWQTNSALMIPSHNGKLLPEEHKTILKRFAKVFEQAYIRFMDLQKAEAQARESKIEMALERVRSRTMAMHKSEELGEVAAVLFEQISSLTYAPERFNIAIGSKEEESFDIWVTDQKGHEVSKRFMFQADKSPVVREVFNAWEKEPYIVQDLHGKKLQEWVRYMQEEIGLPFDEARLSEHRYINSVFFSHGCIGITTNEPPETETLELIERFAKVFQQTYVRFLDLQKAEAQAREAQIEVALERVRSRAMAMHHTDEITDVLGVLFNQFDFLGINPVLTHLTLFDEDNETFTLRITTGGEKRTIAEQLIDVNAVESWKTSFANWKKSELHAVDCIDYPPEVLPAVWEVLDGVMSALPEGQKLFPEDFPNGLYTTQGHCKYGYIGFNHSRRATEEEKEIVVRFAKEFGRLYQRFLDIQKAETQAREAQIEGALERVRSKTMAMHNSEDLEDIVISLFDEVMNLGLDQSIRCGIGILEGHEGMETRSVNKSSDGTVKLKTGMLDMTIHPMLVGLKKAWKNKSAEYSYDYTAKDVRKYYEVLNNEPEYPFNADLETLPEQEFHRSFFFSSGIIFAFSKNPISEESSKILARFATVFGQTYQRFIDLQKAEERAKDAVKQASLDRVRGQIASMRSAEDLERITPLVWNELTILGIPFIRCGVFIIEESNQTVQAFLSAPDGRSLGAMQIPFDAEKNTAETVAHWQKGEVYRTHWDKRQFLQFMQNMIDLGQINNNKEYQGAEEPPESLHLHFVPFTQGMLYVGSEATLTEDQIELVQSLADAFAIAYARYEDFSNLEKAKERVETTLSELKATQNQLVQSEKMASLGELTAGIAHEIQNPLNFVNNFSEVSIELIEEMLEEIQKGDVEEVKALAEDIIQNLEKINHHGKRADGIVKGMLQHSRASSGEKEATDINVLADEYLRLAYHGLRAKDKSFNATLETHFDKSIGKVNVIPQDMGRVILNLITNAFYAVKEKSSFAKASEDDTYEPTVSVITKKLTPPSGAGGVEIRVKDNGNGIPKKVLDKIFQPFFTTKPTGQGTGLGLSMSYDIITKGHGGDLKVDTKEGRGSTFTISIPVS